MPPVLRREWYFPALLALLFVVVGSIPYCYGYATVPDEATFMGFIGRGTPGANSYLAFARQVAEGQTYLTNLYNPTAPARAYLNIEWWLMGATARLTGLSLITVFHGGRVLSVIAFVFAVYYLCGVTLRRPRHRRAALLLICCGTGFGWILYSINGLFGTELALSLDARGVNLFGYLMNKPHFIRAGFFAALQYAWFIRGDQTGETRFYGLSGLAAMGHSIIRPYQIPEACLFLVIYGVIRSCQNPSRVLPIGLRISLAGACHAPIILWHALVYFQNPLGLGAFTAWNPIFLVPQLFWLGLPFAALIGYGLITVSCGRRMRPVFPVLSIWLATAFLLLHSHPYFRWGVESYFAWVFAPPLLFIGYVWPKLMAWHRLKAWPPRLRLIAMVVVVLAVLPGSLLTYYQFFQELHHPKSPWQYYLSEDTRGAIEWLAMHGSERDVVMASHDTSQFIPRFANVRVVSGQDVLTPDYGTQNAHVLRFYQSPGDGGFKQWLFRELGITYVFVGPFERSIAPHDFSRYPWLEPVFEAGDVTLYAVRLL